MKIKGIIIITIAFLAVSCVTYQSEVTINKPKAEVQRAIETAEEKLGMTTGYVSMFGGGYLLSPLDIKEVNGNTTFLLPTNSFPYRENLIDIQKRVLLQELYILDGNTLPPNPADFSRKYGVISLGLFFVNAGWAYNYLYNNNIYLSEKLVKQNRPYVVTLGIIDGIATLMTVGGLVGAFLTGDFDGAFSTLAIAGVSAWGSVKTAVAYDIVDKSFELPKYHNDLLDSGYNWDSSFRVEQVTDFNYSITHREIKQ